MKHLFSLSLICLSYYLQAQTGPVLNPEFNVEQKAVFQVIMDVFIGMQKGDSSMVSKSFVSNPKAFTIFTKDSKTQHRKDNIQNFFNAIGTAHDNVWNEYSWNYDIKIDDSLAQVWCDYAFYLNDKFSHCGVDAFQLVKQEGVWKIFVLSDTRRKIGCDIPSLDKMYIPNN
jgi:hypothetical protein